MKGNDIEEMDNFTIRVFNIAYSETNRTSGQKTNRNTGDKKYHINQLDITDIHRMYHSKPLEYAVFLSAYGILSKTD